MDMSGINKKIDLNIILNSLVSWIALISEGTWKIS